MMSDHHSTDQPTSAMHSHARYRLCLLGTLQLEDQQEPLRGLRSRKAIALLSYLIVCDAAVPRDTLAGLFWPNIPESRGLRNLTWTLWHIDHHFPGCLRLDTYSVSFCANDVLWVDLIVFRYLTTYDTLSALEQAAALYRGEFLQGFALRNCPDFTLWLAQQRAVWHQRTIELIEAIIAHKQQQNEYRQALSYADRLLQLGPLREESHRQRMLLLSLHGQRSAALSQYETCRRILDESLGIAPSDETTRLYRQIRDTAEIYQDEPGLSTAESPQLSYPSLSHPWLPLVGRSADLAQLEAYLADSAIRLITLAGPGGIGKTRLAIELAEQQQHRFRDGVVFVALEGVDSLALLVATIVAALDANGASDIDPIRHLRWLLQSRKLLLILDQFEHLSAHRALLIDLLSAAPELTILVTSRERLRLQIEYFFQLAGLALPAQNNASYDTYAPAIQLFIACAQYFDPTYHPPSEDYPAITAICRAVEGNPLAIALAAEGSIQGRLHQIADSLGQNVDLPTTSLPNIPARHRSFRAVCDATWQLLSAGEQRVLALATIFREGCTQAALLEITGGTHQELSALLDRSLLRRTAAGRYVLSWQIQQHAAEHLLEQFGSSPQDEILFYDRYCAFYLGLVISATAALQGAHPHDTIGMLRSELANIHHAWEWAIRHLLLEQVSQSLQGLSRLYLHLGLFSEAEAFFEHAAEQMEACFSADVQPTKEMLVTLGKLRVEQAYFLSYRAYYDHALEIMEPVRMFARSIGAIDLEALSTYQQAYALGQQGNYEQAQRYAQQALDLARATTLRHVEAWSLCLLGVMLVHQSAYSDGRIYFEQSLQCFQAIGDRMSESESLNCLGMIAWHTGNFEVARGYYQQYLNRAEEYGNHQQIALALHNLADALWPSGDNIGARKTLEQSLQIYIELKDEGGMSMTLASLGRVWLLLGQQDQAMTCCMQSIRIARRHKISWIESFALTSLGLLVHQQGNDSLALVCSRQGLAIADTCGIRDEQAFALTCLGHALVGLGQLDEATESYQRALTLRTTLGQPHWATGILTGLARVAHARGELSRALAYVELILRDLEQRPLVASEERLHTYQTCYMVLVAGKDARAQMLQDFLLAETPAI